MFFLIALLSIPVYADAGFLSFMSELFSGKKGYDRIEMSSNSQNMALLKAALNSDPNPAKGGGDITIVEGTALLPEQGPYGTIADIEDMEPSHGRISVYVVREGDSLSQIASMFGVSVNTIRWANDISSVIHEGQTLIILPISGVRHTVESGDTVAKIAKKYSAHSEEIAQYNNISENASLAVGETVIIPDGEIPVSTEVHRPLRSYAVNYDGYYIRPVGGVRTQGLHGYNGVDIGAPTGTPIVAAAGGKVIISRGWGWNGGYGTYIVISHENGTKTLYAHNSKNIVSAGQWVVQGQVIGYVGSTGKSTGPHVHFEVRGAKNPF